MRLQDAEVQHELPIIDTHQSAVAATIAHNKVESQIDPTSRVLRGHDSSSILTHLHTFRLSTAECTELHKKCTLAIMKM